MTENKRSIPLLCNLLAWRRKHPLLTVAGAVTLSTLGAGGALWACADSSCAPGWQLAAADYDCAGRAMISPGNDTRINMVLLMQSLHPMPDAPAKGNPDPWDRQFGKTFMSWGGLREAYWPQPEQTEQAGYDERVCEPALSGTPAFIAAMGTEPGLPAGERSALTEMRAQTGCNEGAWGEAAITSKPGREYLAYLKAADAFHKNDWARASQGFAALARAKSGWIAETANYMPIRIGLRMAIANAVDEWGDFAGSAKADKPSLDAASSAIDRYLKAYPKGTYAASAEGLKRRVAWLNGDMATLVRRYETLLATTPGSSEAAADLAEEIDNKLLQREDFAALIAAQGKAPLLLAVADFKQMRPGGDDGIGLSASDLAAQKQLFASHTELYGLLEASRTIYGGGDAKAVLALLPDAARQPRFTPLAFSRQTVRGMALGKLRDPNEAGFWRELLAGANPLYQRPLAEMGLAVRWQRDRRVDQIFATSSPITDPTIREVLLQTVASPAILRAAAAYTARPAHERDVARFTLLYKDLTRGAYADFTRDVVLVPANANVDGGLWDFARQDAVPAGLFRKGRWSDGFACPTIAETAATLARTPGDPRARLCLGDFYRLNGFDSFSLFTPDNNEMALGNGPDGFSGKALSRGAIYDAIIADKAAAADVRAYALYRAVMCYAPSGYNGCSGPSRTIEEMDAAQAPQSTRKAWFTELKQRYPQSQWAKNLRYYW
ncbi:hypothetical protein HGI47_13640 [Novosphingobium sp. ERN07]|uniref:hypothetical protein n=1 Tax=Novosphingobium sp. ERN07 TaxID=2726187 RepID=UPI00145767E2|nr:hypothetical protein [Novosphingobium sp. ERN07]NLR71912.1 hypothetical protein [Novosphingobium sp. ERN07]